MSNKAPQNRLWVFADSYSRSLDSAMNLMEEGIEREMKDIHDHTLGVGFASKLWSSRIFALQRKIADQEAEIQNLKLSQEEHGRQNT